MTMNKNGYMQNLLYPFHLKMHVSAPKVGAFRRDWKRPYLRQVIFELVILAENCLTKKMVVYSLALWVLS